MANIEDRGLNDGQPGGAPIGRRQGAPDRLKETDLDAAGRRNDVDPIPEP